MKKSLFLLFSFKILELLYFFRMSGLYKLVLPCNRAVSSHWEWLSFTSSVYTYTIEFDTSYDPNGPQAQAVDVGSFRCLDTLSFSSPPLHFGIRFQIFKPVGSSRKWISKYLNYFFLEIMKAV